MTQNNLIEMTVRNARNYQLKTWAVKVAKELRIDKADVPVDWRDNNTLIDFLLKNIEETANVFQNS